MEQLNYMNYSQILMESFPEDIISSRLNSENELCLLVNGNKIRELADYMSNRLNCPLVDMLAAEEEDFTIYYAFADRENGLLIIIQTIIPKNRPEFPSITEKVPAAALYEREIKDMFGLLPQGHPDDRPRVLHGNWPSEDKEFPLRKDFDRHHKPRFATEEMSFNKVEGTGVYEIPVGPVHAGIIEPGHFRFSVAGEPIINLEAQLGFVHKGIEKLAEGSSIEKCFYISERISGDETFSNSLAYCQAIEKIAGVTIPERAKYTRLIFAELERLICHFGDLSGICTDVAYGFAAAHFNMLRIWSYQLADLLCCVRFLRSVNKPGGVRQDFIAGKEEALKEALKKLKSELGDTVKIINSNNLFIDRVEHTGILDSKIAGDLNAVGPGGRAAGITCDVRKAFPYAAYGSLNFEEHIYEDGDVAARMHVKIDECFESMKLMLDALEAMPSGEVFVEITKVPASKWVFAMTESSRGENIHFVMTGENNTIKRYKVRTPSFCNWPALCHAVNGNIVPDFPLINKSFNLSYAGNDL